MKKSPKESTPLSPEQITAVNRLRDVLKKRRDHLNRHTRNHASADKLLKIIIDKFADNLIADGLQPHRPEIKSLAKSIFSKVPHADLNTSVAEFLDELETALAPIRSQLSQFEVAPSAASNPPVPAETHTATDENEVAAHHAALQDARDYHEIALDDMRKWNCQILALIVKEDSVLDFLAQLTLVSRYRAEASEYQQNADLAPQAATRFEDQMDKLKNIDPIPLPTDKDLRKKMADLVLEIASEEAPPHGEIFQKIMAIRNDIRDSFSREIDALMTKKSPLQNAYTSTSSEIERLTNKS